MEDRHCNFPQRLQLSLLAGMVALLLGAAACAETPEPAQDNSIEAIRTRANAGDAEAQFNLGVMYDAGLGVPQDLVEAVAWYRQAAEQGDADAQYNLGVAYANGLGVPQDLVEAVAWCRQAAEQGYADAQYNLGLMYANGEGVPQDAVEAVAWYRQAAEQGDVGAQYNLGLMYANGAGVPQDDVEAYKWFNLAATYAGSEAVRGPCDGLSPWNGDRARSVRIAARSCASDCLGGGPRRAGTAPRRWCARARRA